MKHMMNILFAVALALASASTLASTPATASTTAAAPSNSAAMQTRLAAVNQYQRDLVSVLALRSDAPHLLGAALLARPLHEEQSFLDFHALITRAAKADDAGAVVRWAMLSDCETGHCPNTEALDSLVESDADNAAVWLMRTNVAIRDGDENAARDALLKAAAAKHYDDYAGSTLQALIAAATSLPVPAATVQAFAGATEAGPASVQAFLAFSLATVQPRPSLIPASRWCDPAHAPSAAGDIHAACVKLAHTLIWGNSPQARAAGLHLRSVLSSDPTAQQTAREAAHDLTWQLRHYSALALKAMDNQALAVEMLKLGRNGGTEMSLITAMLRLNDIPLRAPATDVDTTPPAASPSSAATPPAPAAASSSAPAAASTTAPTPPSAASTQADSAPGSSVAPAAPTEPAPTSAASTAPAASTSALPAAGATSTE